jgi:hypothetical protein
LFWPPKIEAWVLAAILPTPLPINEYWPVAWFADVIVPPPPLPINEYSPLATFPLPFTTAENMFELLFERPLPIKLQLLAAFITLVLPPPIKLPSPAIILFSNPPPITLRVDPVGSRIPKCAK